MNGITLGKVNDMNTEEAKKNMLECLKGRLGNVTAACDDANIGRTTHYKWMNEDPEYKAAVLEVNEMLIDHVEDKLLQRINGVEGVKYTVDGTPVVYEVPPDTTAIIFFLKTRAKLRGYVERQIVQHDGEVTVKQITGMEVK